jgi:hypothetical protein
MMRKSILVLAVSVALTAAAFAAGEGPKTTPTVGEFALKVNTALGNKAVSQKAAADSLRSLGVNLGADLGAPLTEERAAGILADLGVKVTTANPKSPLSAAKADQLLAGVSLSSAASVVPSNDLPTQCLNSPNRGTCVECCKAAVGLIENIQGKLQDPGKVCSNLCKSVLPPGQASPSEPQ